MQTINVRSKELKIKDTSFLIEDEVAPEAIQFILNGASDITDVETLTWLVQYHRSSTDNGFDLIAPENVRYENGIMYITWYPSGGATYNKGKTQIQLVGIVVDTDTQLPIVRWSTAPAVVTLPENIEVNQLSPALMPEYVASLLAQLIELKNEAQQSAEFADNARVIDVSEQYSFEDQGINTITFTYKDGSTKQFTVRNGSKGDKGDKGDTGSQGATGATGKSAYQYAVEQGYTGSEEQFAIDLATVVTIGSKQILGY